MTRTNFDWLNVPAEQAAQRLLGCELESTIDDQLVRVKIVETEAYDQDDAASHTFGGRTKRNGSMYKSAGHLYVYFTYGLHYCLNIVCGEKEYGSGVLVRAVQPLIGENIITMRRGRTGLQATNGPGKTCQALGITLLHTGHDLSNPPLKLIKRPPLRKEQVAIGKRIGISKAVHELRRFYILDNPYVSR